MGWGGDGVVLPLLGLVCDEAGFIGCGWQYGRELDGFQKSKSVAVQAEQYAVVMLLSGATLSS